MLTALGPVVLDALVRRCAPFAGPLTMKAIVERESGGRPFAMYDNTDRRAYDPHDARIALRVAAHLMSAGHQLDLGIAQIDTGNLRVYRISAADAFDPCTNLRVAASILQRNYAAAVRSYGRGQRALAHALSAYNSGSLTGDLSYANAVRRDAAQIAGAR